MDPRGARTLSSRTLPHGAPLLAKLSSHGLMIVILWEATLLITKKRGERSVAVGALL